MGQLIIEQLYVTELPVLIEMFYFHTVRSAAATIHVQLMSTSNVASETEFSILFNFNEV